MGFKKERKHINLVGTRSVGSKIAKAGTRTKRLGRKRPGLLSRPGRPGGRP